MRILIPNYCLEDSFVDNVKVTLTQMGHEVRTLGTVSTRLYLSWASQAWRLGASVLLRSLPSGVERRALKIAREFHPDMVLALTQNIHPIILDELGQICRGRRVLWWGDCPANSSKLGLLDSRWDLIYIKDRATVSKLRLIGRSACLLHEAMNPCWHKPLAKQASDAVVVAGNFYAFRQAIILRLFKDGINFELFGTRPPLWSDPLIKSQYSGRYITRMEKSAQFGRGLACLNTFSLAEGDSLNCRAFEIAGAAGLQLIEYRPVIEECFDPGRELLMFQCYDELLGYIDKAQRYPKEMEIIRQAGAKRALANHTYRHRLEIILKEVS